ncbi:MAG: carbonic anhydrase [Planctomycetota bacterium]|jgi:carbonic anhydrase
MDAQQALSRLQEGNRRFRNGESVQEITTEGVRKELVDGQAPFALILGCADSRVPPELVFDQGLGDLFVIRVAGNLAAMSQIGSVEYAVEHLGVKLVVVLGHTGCGAIAAAVQESEQASGAHPHHLQWLVDRMLPVVGGVKACDTSLEGEPLVDAVRAANVGHAVRTMTTDSPVISRMVEEGNLLVLGAEYVLETGEVRFFDETP